MNYIIWNNKDSREIKGLIISELPPITKPTMRAKETVIDGVDGSIIEELGYESYDKPLLIGITPQANIDEVIKFFSGQGDVVFSNEPDKYYKAHIINQIDYTRLVRFRVATVTFRVQPFKYEYNEQAIILASKSINGKSISYKNNNSKLVELSIDGNSTQEGTPTPDAPVEIKSVGYENLFDKSVSPVKSSGIEYEELETGIKVSLKTVSSYQYIAIPILNSDYLLGKKITLSSDILVNGNNNPLIRLNYIDDKGSVITPLAQLIESGSHTNDVLTSYPDGATQIALFVYANNTSTNANVGDYVEYKNIRVVVGSTPKEYIQYGKYGLDININNITKTIAIDEPLRSLPNGIKDIAHIKGNKLYVNRYVTSEILDGANNWSETRINELFVTHLFQIDLKNNLDNKNINVISSHFVGLNADTLWNNDVVGVAVNSNGFIQISCNLTTVDEFKTWLSENNIQVDYALETPITEEYDINSIFELVEGANAITNGESANMTMAHIDNKLLVTNTGNYISKPVMTIKGFGTIEFILNGNKLFRYVFPEREDAVVIDSQKQDAYLGDVLKNRSMTGEFPTLEIGDNIITWEGNIESIEISLKSRWL